MYIYIHAYVIYIYYVLRLTFKNDTGEIATQDRRDFSLFQHRPAVPCSCRTLVGGAEKVHKGQGGVGDGQGNQNREQRAASARPTHLKITTIKAPRPSSAMAAAPAGYAIPMFDKLTQSQRTPTGNTSLSRLPCMSCNMNTVYKKK